MGKLPTLKTRTNEQLLFSHALTHRWRKNLRRFGFTCVQVRAEHNRLVRKMKTRTINHNSPMGC